MARENGKDEEVKEVVKVRAKSMIYPSKDAEKSECKLATFDLPYLVFYYNQKILLYRGGDFDEMVGKLKEGLLTVLEHFYPLLGRLGKDEEGVIVVERCGDRGVGGGVEVLEAVAEEVEVEELAQDGVSILLHHLLPFNGVLNLEGFHKPLLAVQFTKLKDGIALGCAFNHVILDGHSTWHFMLAWAEICRGCRAPSLLPFHDRTQARDVRVKLDLPPPIATADASSVPLPLPEKIFQFSGSAVSRIKEEVNAGRSTDSKPFTTFQSLGVHIWRAITRARGLKPEDYTVFTIFIGCRKRVNPAMPGSYFGNLIQAIFTVTSAGMLLAHPPEFGAGMLQQVIDSHDAKAIVARLEQWEAAPKLLQYEDAGMNIVAIGSSPTFKVYDADFGWGPPARVRSGSNNKFDGMVYLYPGREGGTSVDVEISLEAKALENLENDTEFTLV